MAETVPAEAPPHPEEMKGSFALKLGGRTVLEGSGRMTPAGVICAGLAATAILLAFGYLARAARPPRRR